MNFTEISIYPEESVDKYLYESKSMEDLPKIQDCIMGDKNSDFGIVLQHGFVGSNIELLFISNELAKLGYRIAIPILPGHGKNYHELHKVNHTDWINKHNKAIEYLKSEKSGRKIILIGHSLGGTLTLYHAAVRDDIFAIVSLAAPARYPTILRLAAKIMASLCGKCKLKYDEFNFHDKRLYNNPYVHMLIENYGYITYHSINEAFLLINKSIDNLQRIKQPALIIQSKYEDVVSKKSASIIYEAISSEYKEIHMLEESYHIVVADTDKRKVVNLIIEFLNKIIHDEK